MWNLHRPKQKIGGCVTWIKLEDTFPTNPKIASLSDREYRLYLHALCWCGLHLTDGSIPIQIVNKLGIKNASKHANKLVEIGLWIKVEGGYQVHDYLKHQTSKAQAEQEKETNRLRAQKARKARAERERNAVTSVGVTVTDTHTPTHTPTPTIKDKEVQIVRTAFEQFWNVYPRRDGKKKALEAMGKALKKASIEVILKGVANYKSGPLVMGQIPAMPATWLNGERWNDEVLASANTVTLQRLPIAHKAINAPGQHGVEICANCGNSWPCTKSQENPF